MIGLRDEDYLWGIEAACSESWCTSNKKLRKESRASIPPPEISVKCPLEAPAKDGLARRLSPCNCVPIENMTAKSP